MVLAIDDELEIRSLLADLLGSAGIEARAVGPFEALTTLERLAPQVVLLDVAMPGVDGYHILRHLRADARLASSFVLMVTASAGLSEMAAGIECGADDYLTKPFSVDELLARVRIGLGFSGSAC